MDTLEQMIARHCAPALAGIKAAGLVSCCRKKHPDIEKRISQWNVQMNQKGIFFEKLSGRDCRILLLVYRKKSLEEHLQRNDVNRLMDETGYPQGGIDARITHLKKRICEAQGFPHEIGLFLGYPPEDVEGFMEYGGRNYKLNGYWKVYSDEYRARTLFERYTKCRDAVCRRLMSGYTLGQLFAAA